jgi:hypothetical protein
MEIDQESDLLSAQAHVREELGVVYAVDGSHRSHSDSIPQNEKDSVILTVLWSKNSSPVPFRD